MATVPRVRINMLGFTCHAQIPKAGQRQACNGVVQLDEIEVIDRQPCARQQLSHGRNRANAHDTRFDTCRRAANHSCKLRQSAGIKRGACATSSTSPGRARPFSPDMMPRAATEIAAIPDSQCRLTVNPTT